MANNLAYLEGKTICVVYCRQEKDDINSNKMQISTLHGTATIKDNNLYVSTGSGFPIIMPQSSYRNIYPNDGTKILKNAQYFIMVKVRGELH